MRLIDADALKGVIETYRPALIYNNKTDMKNRMVDYFLDEIDNAPTVEEVSVIEFKEPLPMVKAQKIVKALSKRSQGEWTVTKLQHGEDVTCPFCNARPTKSEYGYYLRDNFCHECGADMRKGGAE